jgi:5,6,7,8-tetrahydromethanopterin hydro-lyase
VTPQIGTGSAGDGLHQVRVDTVFGDRDGPVGAAFFSSMSAPTIGHTPFVVLARPNLPVVPMTLFVPNSTIGSDRHARLTRGAAHAGVAAGVLASRMEDPDGETCIVASVWVDPDVSDADRVYRAARDATMLSLKMGAAGGPWRGHLLEVGTPENDDFRRD